VRAQYVAHEPPQPPSHYAVGPSHHHVHFVWASRRVSHVSDRRSTTKTSPTVVPKNRTTTVPINRTPHWRVRQ
jgi:hypothetical protein